MMVSGLSNLHQSEQESGGRVLVHADSRINLRWEVHVNPMFVPDFDL